MQAGLHAGLPTLLLAGGLPFVDLVDHGLDLRLLFRAVQRHHGLEVGQHVGDGLALGADGVAQVHLRLCLALEAGDDLGLIAGFGAGDDAAGALEARLQAGEDVFPVAPRGLGVADGLQRLAQVLVFFFRPLLGFLYHLDAGLADLALEFLVVAFLGFEELEHAFRAGLIGQGAVVVVKAF